MSNKPQIKTETVVQMEVPIYCPTEDAEGNLYVISTSGEVYQMVEGSMEQAFLTGG